MQVVGHVTGGERLAIPTPDQIPGPPGAGSFPGLPAYVDLLQNCWAQDPEQRPLFAAIVQELRCAFTRNLIIFVWGKCVCVEQGRQGLLGLARVCCKGVDARKGHKGSDTSMQQQCSRNQNQR